MKTILIVASLIFLTGCAISSPTQSVPTSTPAPTVTDTPAPPRRLTETPTVEPIVVPPTETPTTTPTIVWWTPEPPLWPTPTGMVCEIEQQWGRGVNHDYEYGCFAVTCWFANGSIYGNNLACMNPAIGTPWPYKWMFYHPLQESIE